MASPANNRPSSSPLIPNRPNTKPRNSEAADPMRRSFAGTPFSANSRVNIPSDSRRNSFGRENSRVEFSDKENEIKASTTPKGSKNFMSPTISAVSKINASPRKRVLSERNEVCRSCDVRGLILEETKRHNQAKSCVSFSDVIQVIGIDEMKQFDESHDMTTESKGIAYSPSEFAACEVDPPYDPKKNYLSPRPQFLHYRPNPRIEQECKQLEGLFISESSSSSSDTELSSVEESEKSEEQEKEIEEEEEEEEEVEDSEQLEIQGIEETSQVLKQSGFRKFKSLAWLLALALGCMLISATFSSPRFSFSEFHIPKEVEEFSKANNLEQLSEKLWTLTASSLVYMDKLISCLGGEDEFGPLRFHNLTNTMEDFTVFQPTSVEIISEEAPLEGENNLVDDDAYEEEENSFEEVSEGGEEYSDVFSETKDSDTETDNVCDEQTEMKLDIDIEFSESRENLEALFEERESEVVPEENNDARGIESQEKLETGHNKKDQEELEDADSEATNINKHDVESSTAIINMQQQQLQSTENESEAGFGETATEETSDDLGNDFTKEMMIVLSSTVLVVLLASVAFLLTKKAKIVAPSAPEPAATEKLKLSHETVDDRISTSFHNNVTEGKENQSSSKLRRESMASSASEYSTGSFSYGSFTSYEKIPIKSGDEEMITPVRRSSRLRNHHHHQSSSGL